MKEEDKIDRMEFYKEQGWTFQTFQSGHTEPEQEKLLPTGYQEAADYAGTPPKTAAELKQEQRDKSRPDAIRSKRPVASDDENLYPLGVEIEDED